LDINRMLSTSQLDTLARIRKVRMRSLAFVLVTPLLACSASTQHIDQLPPDTQTAIDGGTSLMPPAHGFQLMSPTIDIDPGAEVTYCYYFRTPNTGELLIQRWASHMTPGSHHMILYLTPTDQQPPGTMSPTNCGITKGTGGPVWTYSAQTPDAESQLPSDDGNGNPVGQVIKARQSGFLQMHYLNATDSVIHAHVELNAYAYPDSVQVTPAAPFVTSNLDIQLMPGSPTNPTMGMVNGSCPVPLDPTGKPPRFFMMTTHTHKQGVHTFVKDGATTVFDSMNWEHPGTAIWPTPPTSQFYTFKSDTLFYQCEYLNPNNRTILTGDSAATDEMCMAIGYFFPAAGGIGHFCLNSAIVY
jgi:hypothetical protein